MLPHTRSPHLSLYWLVVVVLVLLKEKQRKAVEEEKRKIEEERDDLKRQIEELQEICSKSKLIAEDDQHQGEPQVETTQPSSSNVQ